MILNQVLHTLARKGRTSYPLVNNKRSFSVHGPDVLVDRPGPEHRVRCATRRFGSDYNDS